MGIWYKQIGESICKGPAMTKEALSHSNVQNPKTLSPAPLQKVLEIQGLIGAKKDKNFCANFAM
jgi:hypothetical protein